MSRVFDLLCIRSYDFILWWFDIDYILFDFIFDMLVSITFIFVFIIGFFIRIMFSFIFVIIVINNAVSLNAAQFCTNCIFIFIFSIYSFISFFVNTGILTLLFFYEFILFNLAFIFNDFSSKSSHLVWFNAQSVNFCIFFCSFVFCLFYFILLFLFAFIFFIIRSLYTICFDFIFNNFDLQFSINCCDIINIKFSTLCVLSFSCIFTTTLNIFNFFSLVGYLFLTCFFLVAIVFTYSLLYSLKHGLLISNLYWYLFCNSLNFSQIYNTLLIFFKYAFNEIFFVYNFSTIVFIISFFGIMIKDFVFLTASNNYYHTILSFDTLNNTVFNYNILNWNLSVVLTLC